MVHSIFLKYGVYTSQYMDFYIWPWIKLLKNSFINIVYFIIFRTENDAIQKVLVIFNPLMANP